MSSEFKVVWSRHGATSLEDAVDFLDRQSTTGANNFREDMQRTVERIRLLPQSGTLVEIRERTEVRETIIYPYRLYYSIDVKKCRVEILLLHHSKRAEPSRFRTHDS